MNWALIGNWWGCKLIVTLLETILILSVFTVISLLEMFSKNISRDLHSNFMLACLLFDYNEKCKQTGSLTLEDWLNNYKISTRLSAQTGSPSSFQTS